MSQVSEQMEFEGVSIRATHPTAWDGRIGFVLAHGAGQSMDSPFMSFFHSSIAEMGHLSVKFNFSYMEKGRKVPDASGRLQATYAGVVKLVQGRFQPGVLVGGGKSMGGRIASYLAADLDTIDGLLFLGYPLHPPGNPGKMRDAHLYALRQPMLFISGTRDALAKRELLEDVVGKIGKQATLFWVEGGDHSLRVRKKDTDGLPAALEAIRTWSERLS